MVLWCELALSLDKGEERAGGEDGHRHLEDYAHQQPVPVFSVGPGGALSLRSDNRALHDRHHALLTEIDLTGRGRLARANINSSIASRSARVVRPSRLASILT